MAALVSPPERRRLADLARIHSAKKALGWDDDTYRDVLQQVCGVRSAKDLDGPRRALFLRHLERCGWKPEPARQVVRGVLNPKQRRMFSLWQELADAGEVRDRRMTALAKYATRITGVARLDWKLTPQQEDLVIESLKKWLARLQVGAAKEVH